MRELSPEFILVTKRKLAERRCAPACPPTTDCKPSLADGCSPLPPNGCKPTYIPNSEPLNTSGIKFWLEDNLVFDATSTSACSPSCGPDHGPCGPDYSPCGPDYCGPSL